MIHGFFDGDLYISVLKLKDGTITYVTRDSSEDILEAIDEYCGLGNEKGRVLWTYDQVEAEVIVAEAVESLRKGKIRPSDLGELLDGDDLIDF